MTGSSEPAFFPIIVMGKYEESGGAVRMPVALSIAHAVADGYHAALFFRYLQEEMDALAASGAGTACCLQNADGGPLSFF